MKNKRIVLYCRAACNNQEDNALDVQEKMLKEYAESQGYKVVEIIKEFCGGTSFNRDGINKIYETVNKYKADAVIANDLIMSYAYSLRFKIL